jgi:hypothetical protein
MGPGNAAVQYAHKPTVQMKQLHWKKIPNNKIPGTVWEKIDFHNVTLDSPQIEKLFGAKPKKSQGLFTLTHRVKESVSQSVSQWVSESVSQWEWLIDGGFGWVVVELSDAEAAKKAVPANPWQNMVDLKRWHHVESLQIVVESTAHCHHAFGWVGVDARESRSALEELPNRGRGLLCLLSMYAVLFADLSLPSSMV